MRCGGREVRYRTNYILGTGCHLLQNVTFQDARNKTDHYLFLGCLCGDAPTAHLRYLRKHTRLPIKPPTTPNGVDHLFAELREAITKPPRRERLHHAWISPEIWRLIDTRIAACRTRDQRNSRGIRRTTKVILQEDRRQRAVEMGSAVESLLASDPPIIQMGMDTDESMVQRLRIMPPTPACL